MKFVAKCMVNVDGTLHRAGEIFEADESLMKDLKGAADVVEETTSAAPEGVQDSVEKAVEEKSEEAPATRRSRRKTAAK